ncbi:hypothetical protein BD309DRAFT_878763 [Dichomitus squalens]|uniref:Uncharacterized protein n=2 Tax=Dichomitus squalens TaxID=114155 RepID=A0A4Q9N6C7_9APHY|nr:uncharacterized protein DICSQDRAFT_175638 [Dichomitus squalens LYAD-421 SS1]EJF55676.1 hypothetical protein DICSQDRAFT_175638 [Dichomitus squalens LYAD-421 SS1]TBU21533.1 hypothetical protein BD311DRAFT_734268 [Dichomitus squalens]TBU36199.1 hypothetical protein BD309DRAFT_878763 [Dichomitus squalens]
MSQYDETSTSPRPKFPKFHKKTRAPPSPTAEVESVPLPERVTASSSPTPEGQSPVNHSIPESPDSAW